MNRVYGPTLKALVVMYCAPPGVVGSKLTNGRPAIELRSHVGRVFPAAVRSCPSPDWSAQLLTRLLASLVMPMSLRNQATLSAMSVGTKNRERPGIRRMRNVSPHVPDAPLDTLAFHRRRPAGATPVGVRTVLY